MHSQLPQKTALIADDSKSSRDLLRYILAFEGFKVVEASDGQEVLEKVATVTPDVFILDLNMPRCDGYTAARELRRLALFAHTPIIALSAVAALTELSTSNDSCFNLFLSKPLSPSKLRACLRVLS